MKDMMLVGSEKRAGLGYRIRDLGFSKKEKIKKFVSLCENIFLKGEK
jgi:hypothetical protein